MFRGFFAFSEKQQHYADHIDYHQGPCIRRLLIGCRGLFRLGQHRINWRRAFSQRFCAGKRQFFAGILCVWQEKNNEFPTKKIGCRLSTHLWGAASGKELFQTKVKIHKRLFALLLVFALVIGLLPSVLADNEPSTAESAEETLVEFQPEESPAISPPTQSILESDEAVEDSKVDAENETPTSMDGETLTRIQLPRGVVRLFCELVRRPVRIH